MLQCQNFCICVVINFRRGCQTYDTAVVYCVSSQHHHCEHRKIACGIHDRSREPLCSIKIHGRVSVQASAVDGWWRWSNLNDHKSIISAHATDAAASAAAAAAITVCRHSSSSRPIDDTSRVTHPSRRIHRDSSTYTSAASPAADACTAALSAKRCAAAAAAAAAAASVNSGSPNRNIRILAATATITSYLSKGGHVRTAVSATTDVVCHRRDRTCCECIGCYSTIPANTAVAAAAEERAAAAATATTANHGHLNS